MMSSCCRYLPVPHHSVRWALPPRPEQRSGPIDSLLHRVPSSFHVAGAIGFRKPLDKSRDLRRPLFLFARDHILCSLFPLSIVHTLGYVSYKRRNGITFLGTQ